MFETFKEVLTVLASGLPDSVSDQFQVVPKGTDHKQAYRHTITGRPFWQTLLSFFSFSSFFQQTQGKGVKIHANYWYRCS
jgi:hypothetical protein